MSDPEALGQRLRAAREAKELTLADAEQATRIRAKYLEALEAGDYSSMTPVQAQGFLRNYARFLGLDLALLMQELENAPSAHRRKGRRRKETRAEPGANGWPVPPPRPAPAGRGRVRRGFMSNALIVVIAGAIVTALILGVTRLIDSLVESQAAPTQPGMAAVETLPLSTPSEALTLTETLPAGGEGLAETETPPAPAAMEQRFSPPTLTGTNVTVLIEVAQPSWVRVVTDGVMQYEGLARAGEILNYTGQQSVSVRTNNAAGLRLTVNNQPQGVLGARGELFDYTFTLAGGEVSTPSGLSAGDTFSSTLPGQDAVAAAPLTASPEGATLLFTGTLLPPTPTLPLDPGDLSVLETITITPLPGLSPTATATLPPPLTDTPTLAATTALLPPSPTFSPAATLTSSPTGTPPPTATATASPTATFTPAATVTASPTATRTPTATWTASPTRTPTLTASFTPTWSTTPTPTPSPTPFLPPRYTRTPTPTGK